MDWIGGAIMAFLGLLLMVFARKLVKSGHRTETGLLDPVEAQVKRNRFFGFAILVLGVGQLLLDLPKKDFGKAKSPEWKDVTPAPRVNFGPPVTEEEGRGFGMKLEAAVAAGDKEAVERLLRTDELVMRCLSDLNMDAALRNAYLTGFRRRRGQLGEVLIDTVRRGGQYTFLRVQHVNGRLRVVMRLQFADQGLNYYAITLARFADKAVGAEDTYTLLTGEILSQTMRWTILSLLAEQDRGTLAKLSNSEQLFSKHLPDLKAMTDLMQQGKSQDALAIYRRLPPELQQEKVVQLRGLVAANNAGDADYLPMLERFRRSFPDDAGIDLLSFDYHLLKKQYAEALHCVDRVNKAVGGDPFLLVMKGQVLAQTERFAEAKDVLEQALSQDPKLVDACWCRAETALREKNHADALVWLKKFVEMSDRAPDEEFMKKNDVFAEFLKSPQCKEYLDWLKSRQP